MSYLFFVFQFFLGHIITDSGEDPSEQAKTDALDSIEQALGAEPHDPEYLLLYALILKETLPWREESNPTESSSLLFSSLIQVLSRPELYTRLSTSNRLQLALLVNSHGNSDLSRKILDETLEYEIQNHGPATGEVIRISRALKNIQELVTEESETS